MTTEMDKKTIMLSPNPDRRVELWNADGNIIQVIQFSADDAKMIEATNHIASCHLRMAPGNCVNICSA